MLYSVSSWQIILALGNYMNSSKRGAVYGFKLQSLDLVSKPEVPCGDQVGMHFMFTASGCWGTRSVLSSR